ncbi:MAG: Phosphate transporter, inorganic phosphate transporter, PiT family [Dehalococcoidia bacterium]|nr:Phosphate transporter, inorganic phosphate transporter, PiT family [Dehalococcoidia bacterium]
MPDLTLAAFVVIGLVLVAEFVNGWTDAPNAIATAISTRVLTPRQAVVIAVVMNILGAMSGTAVAVTIGKGIVLPEAIDLTTVAAAMTGIIIWSTMAYRYGLPTSESHALVAGLAGAGLATAGPSVLLWAGWQKVLIGLLFSTFLGFGLALVLTTVLLRVFARARLGPTRTLFARLSLLSTAFLAFSHGSNDGQKFMGILALTMVMTGVFDEFHIPFWIILLAASTMGLGTAFGGWRIIRTIGIRLTKLETVHGFAAQTSAGIAIQLASHFGIPLSTTHTANTAVMGVGASKRFSAVRWGVSRQIVGAWILTFPVCGAIAWVMAKLLGLVF